MELLPFSHSNSNSPPPPPILVVIIAKLLFSHHPSRGDGILKGWFVSERWGGGKWKFRWKGESLRNRDGLSINLLPTYYPSTFYISSVPEPNGNCLFSIVWCWAAEHTTCWNWHPSGTLIWRRERKLSVICLGTSAVPVPLAKRAVSGHKSRASQTERRSKRWRGVNRLPNHSAALTLH